MLFKYFLDRQELFINHKKFSESWVDEKYVLKEIWNFWPKSWINPFGKIHFLVLKDRISYSQKMFFSFKKIVKAFFPNNFDEK